MLKSTVPGNEYAIYSGTSMACPAVSGVAALVLSQHPNMTGEQLKAILLRQVRLYPDLQVRLPGAARLDLPVLFSELSSTGGVVDALASLRLAKMLSEN